MASNRQKTVNMVYIAMFSVLITVCSWISIPTTIPFTMQTFAVFITLNILGGRRGTLSVLVYLLMAAIHLPVLAGFSGGIGALMGPTGGYLLGFLLMALVVWLFERLLGDRNWVKILSMALGTVVLYTFGTAWFMIVYTQKTGPIGLMTALGWCVFPYILPDAAKIALALVLGNRLRPLINKPRA